MTKSKKEVDGREQIAKLHYAYNSAFAIMKRCAEVRPRDQDAQRKIFEFSEQIVEALDPFVYVNLNKKLNKELED